MGMKLVALLALTTGVTCHLSDNDMVKHWEMTQAWESCWGEDNMKLWTVTVKHAMAMCAHQDAPELSLPPFRSAHRFVNTMHGSSNNQRQDGQTWCGDLWSLSRRAMEVTLYHTGLITITGITWTMK